MTFIKNNYMGDAMSGHNKKQTRFFD